MNKVKENLIACKNDYIAHGQPAQIHLIWKDGKKSGIGNPTAINVIMDAIYKELDKQINNA